MRIRLGLLMVVVACALLVVKGQQQARTAFIVLQQAQQQQRQLEEEWGRLQLEQSTWGMHARVGQLAVDQLGMQMPTAAQEHVLFDKSVGTQP